MSAVVEQFNGRNGLHTRYYLHELDVLDKEKATNTLHTDHFSGKQDVVAFTYNILNEAANVNNRAKDDRVKSLRNGRYRYKKSDNVL